MEFWDYQRWLRVHAGHSVPFGGFARQTQRCTRGLRKPCLSYFSFTPSKAAASARNPTSSSSLDWFLSIHWTALSYHERACGLSPSCQWAIARNASSVGGGPPFFAVSSAVARRSVLIA